LLEVWALVFKNRAFAAACIVKGRLRRLVQEIKGLAKWYLMP